MVHKLQDVPSAFLQSVSNYLLDLIIATMILSISGGGGVIV